MMNSDLIFDLGMHSGEDTEFYLLKGYRVVTVEANPVLVRYCRSRFAHFLGEGRLIIVGKGITQERSDSIPFYVNRSQDQWSSFDKRIGSRGLGASVVMVPTITTEDLIAEFGMPYYMKIDIEGFDWMPIAALSSFEELPKYLSAENGHEPMLDQLKDLGYKKYKYVRQQDLYLYTLPNPAKEGKYIDYRFTKGRNSGPFGEETPGPWVTYGEALYQLKERKRNPDPRYHYDIHVTF